MKAILFVPIVPIVVVIASLLAMSTVYNAMAFPHAHMTIDSDEENVNPISVVIGHSNEPAFGARLALHDGKHAVEVLLEDSATALPISGASLTVDKYFFRNIDSFNNSTSVEDGDLVEANATLSGVFGEPGHYVNRQIVRDGIYGYHVYGTIDYFGVGEVPLDTTIFCNSSEGDTSKYNSDGWGGGFGCPDNLNDIHFPPRSLPRAAPTPTSTSLQTSSEDSGSQQYQVLSMGLPVAGLAAFLGIRQWKQRNKKDSER